MLRGGGTGLISGYLIDCAANFIVHIGVPILFAKKESYAAIGIETEHLRDVDGVCPLMGEDFLCCVCF